MHEGKWIHRGEHFDFEAEAQIELLLTQERVQNKERVEQALATENMRRTLRQNYKALKVREFFVKMLKWI